jgi:PhnB protein
MKYINAYLIFDGNCREAMEFYARNFEADLQLSPFSDAPGTPKEAKDRIIHARMTKGNTILMASDNMPGMPYTQGNSYWVSVQCESLAEIEKLFPLFTDGGKVSMPLQDTFWNARFGMLTDRFGVNWMFNFEKGK